MSVVLGREMKLLISCISKSILSRAIISGDVAARALRVMATAVSLFLPKSPAKSVTVLQLFAACKSVAASALMLPAGVVAKKRVSETVRGIVRFKTTRHAKKM